GTADPRRTRAAGIVADDDAGYAPQRRSVRGHARHRDLRDVVRVLEAVCEQAVAAGVDTEPVILGGTEIAIGEQHAIVLPLRDAVDVEALQVDIETFRERTEPAHV